MRYIFILVAVLVSYGSLYPFTFGGGGWDEVLDLLRSAMELPRSRADLLGNFALFVPFGYCGMFAFNRPRTLALRVVLVTALGTALAVALQIGQVFLPSRDPTLGDAFVNGAGTVVGACVATIPYLRPGPLGGLGALDRAQTIAWLIIASWLGYRLMPFVPSLDVQSIKDSVKPLVREPTLIKSRVFRDTVAWTVVAYLWEHAPLGRFRWTWLCVLMGLTFFGEILVVNNVVYLHSIVGAGIAFFGWWLIGRRLPRRALLVAALLATSQVVHGLYPFVARPEPAAFGWVPFGAFLDGTMIINATVFFEKFFHYGAFLRLLQLAGVRLPFAAAVGVLITGAIEFAQTRYAGHSPDITDPVLVVIFATVLWAVERSAATSSPAGPSSSSTPTSRPD